MLAQRTQAPVSARWRERPQPWAARLEVLVRRLPKAVLGIGAAMLVVSVVVFLRIVLTAHMVPRWQEALAHVLPFLN
jgi:hypothetical protein